MSGGYQAGPDLRTSWRGSGRREDQRDAPGAEALRAGEKRCLESMHGNGYD
jgi:hypothetical protein